MPAAIASGVAGSGSALHSLAESLNRMIRNESPGRRPTRLLRMKRLDASSGVPAMLPEQSSTYTISRRATCASATRVGGSINNEMNPPSSSP